MRLFKATAACRGVQSSHILHHHPRHFCSVTRQTRNANEWEADAIARYAQRSITPITLRELLKTAERPVTPAKILQSAQYVAEELPVRVARRLADLQQLPFIVGTNPHIRRVYMLYLESFEKLRQGEPPTSAESEREFARTLAELVDSHADVIPLLARGISECRQYMHADEIRHFLDQMIQARIGIRVIAEHHLALHDTDPAYSGIVHHQTCPRDIIGRAAVFAQELCEHNYGVYPDFQVGGHTDTTFPYIDIHLEYIMLELLKNSFRATVEFHRRRHGSGAGQPPPVEITIARGRDDVGIRIRDRGGGIAPGRESQVWDYAFTTVNGSAADGPTAGDNNIFAQTSQLGVIAGTGGQLAGLGYGLPMSRIYARWAGGSLDMMPLHEYGCDLFLRLPHIGPLSLAI